MINKRLGLFETNSSSSHSISVSKLDRGYSELFINNDGIIEVTFGEFGWGPDILSLPEDKLSYYLTDLACSHGISYGRNKWDDGIKKIRGLPEFKELLDILKCRYPNFKDICFIKTDEDEYYQFGYVDHQSTGTSLDKDIKELIFNNSYIIIIDNDNSYHFEDYSEPDIYMKGGKPHKDIEELWDLQ